MLDRRALRVHGISLVAAMWCAFAWTQATSGGFDRFGKLRGMDFLQFYAAGRIVADGRGESLYDWDAFAEELPGLVSGLGDVLYLSIYPPQTALLFAPLAALTYLPALLLWGLVSAGLYGGALWALWRSLPSLRPYKVEALAFGLGFPPFVHAIAHGQIGTLAVPLLVVAWTGVRDGRPFLAGVALGSLFFKPQLGTLALAALVLMPSVRLLAGLSAGAAAQILLAAAVLGWQVWADYLHVIASVTSYVGSFEPKLWAMHSLRGAVLLAAGHSALATALWLGTVAGAVLLARRAWGRQPHVQVRFALIGLLGVLVNPHLYVYDLVLISVPLALLTAWLVERQDPADRWVGVLAYSLVWLPLLGPLASITHIQLTAPAVVLLLWALGHQTDSRRPAVATAVSL